MKIENFITTGCSFTSGVFNFDSSLENSQSIWEETAFSWPHFVFSNLGVDNKKFLNFAIPGCGNIAAMTNLVLFLEKYTEYNGSNTLVGINLTELNRSDTITDKDDPKANKDPSNQHVRDYLDIGWINHKFENYHLNFEYQTSSLIVQTFNYLETKKINYFFMLMIDDIYYKSPQFFQKFLNSRRDKWVTFDKTKSMKKFVVDKKLTVSNNDTHPNKQGHKVISDYVTDHLRKKLIL